MRPVLPIRIYALAKELQIDNKKLVDICTRAGITGKGSALASLTDEEVVRLKAFMAGGKGGKADGAPARTADAGATRSIRREDYIAPTGTTTSTRVPVLPAKPDKPPLQRKRPEETAAPVRPVVDVPPAAAAPATPPIAATATVEPVAVAPPAAVAVSPAPASPITADPGLETKSPVKSPAAVAPPTLGTAAPLSPPASVGPIPPMMRQRPPMPGPLQRLLGKRTQDSKPSERQGGEKPGVERPAGEKKPAERTTPAMHLAPMPAQSKALAKHKPKEPVPQKPDIKLPPDAIRASKAGSKPLSEHLRKHEEKKKRDDLAAKKGTSRAGTPGAEIVGIPVQEPASGKERPRRGGVVKAAGAEEEREGAGLSTLGGREQRQAKRKRSTTAKPRGSG